jgi:hypothetical protein
MRELTGAPHSDIGSDDFLEGCSCCAFRISEALEHNQCGCPRGMCCREQRCCGESAIGCDDNRFAAPEIVEHCGDAVGPLLQGRQRTRCKGIGHSRAGLVEEDEPTERRHRLDPPLQQRQLRKNLAVCGGKDEHDVASPGPRGAIGDAQVPVQRVTRLGEHGGSLSREAGHVSSL